MKFYIGPMGNLIFVDEIQAGLTQGLRQTLKARLGTQLGRRLWRPDYGLDLREFLMRRLSAGDRARLRRRVRAAVADLNPASVVVGQPGGPNTLEVVIIL